MISSILVFTVGIRVGLLGILTPPLQTAGPPEHTSARPLGSGDAATHTAHRPAIGGGGRRSEGARNVTASKHNSGASTDPRLRWAVCQDLPLTPPEQTVIPLQTPTAQGTSHRMNQPTSVPTSATTSAKSPEMGVPSASLPGTSGYPPPASFPRIIDGHVMRPTDRFIPSHLRYRVDPVYPAEATRNGMQGTVEIHESVSADGTVRSLKLVSGPPPLASAALDAARYWRYIPALLNGQPVDDEQDIEIVFRLN